ncbi:DUF4435 domain-containing protein [Pseudoalteromonas sp. PB2-1]|uniref:DUF4435 domain-containing protein n=1 Tax=Pseudoalteromonas sp. PB2-1 TaxID=2907242 RepID=UPI00386E13A9
MSRVNLLVEARDNLSVKFMEFTRITSKGKCAIFFEGEDEKYYSVRISNIRPELNWSGINSGGKSKVVMLRDKVRKHNTYSSSNCLFFVDSDFDDNNELNSLHDVYVTPCYSIENFYVSNSAFQRILSAEFGITDSIENHQCFENAINLFTETKASFLGNIKPFNSFIRTIRMMEKTGDCHRKLNINNIKFEDLISVSLDSTEKNYDEKNPKSIFQDLDNDIVINTSESDEYLSDLDGEIWFRGKQNLEFFRIYLDKLKQDRCKKNGRQVFKNKGNVKLQLSKGNCLSELSQYADTPGCLVDFLNSHKAA